jgi:hypothetical protein
VAAEEVAVGAAGCGLITISADGTEVHPFSWLRYEYVVSAGSSVIVKLVPVPVLVVHGISR